MPNDQTSAVKEASSPAKDNWVAQHLGVAVGGFVGIAAVGLTATAGIAAGASLGVLAVAGYMGKKMLEQERDGFLKDIDELNQRMIKERESYRVKHDWAMDLKRQLEDPNKKKDLAAQEAAKKAQEEADKAAKALEEALAAAAEEDRKLRLAMAEANKKLVLRSQRLEIAQPIDAAYSQLEKKNKTNQERAG
jgi:hypothetical protein